MSTPDAATSVIKVHLEINCSCNALANGVRQCFIGRDSSKILDENRTGDFQASGLRVVCLLHALLAKISLLNKYIASQHELGQAKYLEACIYGCLHGVLVFRLNRAHKYVGIVRSPQVSIDSLDRLGDR